MPLETLLRWQHVNNLVTHPVPIHPVHGPVVHEADFQTALNIWNKTCPTDKTADSRFVNRGQNLSLQAQDTAYKSHI